MPIPYEKLVSDYQHAIEIADAAQALLDWAREHTSPRGPNSPHDLLVRLTHALANRDAADTVAALNAMISPPTPPKRYSVSVQVFTCSGDDIEVEATGEVEAEYKAKEIATIRFASGNYETSYTLNEVCVSSISEVK